MRLVFVAIVFSVACARPEEKPATSTDSSAPRVVTLRQDSVVAPSPASGADTLDALTERAIEGGLPIGLVSCLVQDNENKALECAHGRTRRVGDTLLFRVAGAEAKRINALGGEGGGTGFQYVGTIGDSVIHVIRDYGCECVPTYTLIMASNGKHIELIDLPIISPNGTHFTANTIAWANCDEGGPSHFEIWRFTDSVPVLERGQLIQPCKRNEPRGWGALSVHWRSDDTLDFVRSCCAADRGSASTERTPMVMVRQNGRWMMHRP